MITSGWWPLHQLPVQGNVGQRQNIQVDAIRQSVLNNMHVFIGNIFSNYLKIEGKTISGLTSTIFVFPI